MPAPILNSTLALSLGLFSLQAAAQIAMPAGAGSPAHELVTIATLDVPRYLGTWYEIAKFPNRFQRKCAGETSAQYSENPDGTLQVVNRCRLADGQLEEAVGQARQVGGADSPTLKVRFAPAWLSFLPIVWGDYWIIDLDEHYQLAAVSEPSREYLWILSRTPRVDSVAYAALVDRLARQGLVVNRLERTRQD